MSGLSWQGSLYGLIFFVVLTSRATRDAAGVAPEYLPLRLRLQLIRVLNPVDLIRIRPFGKTDPDP